MKPNFLEWLDTQRGRQYDLHSRYINPAFVKMLRTTGFDKAYVRGEGSYLYDAEGIRYLDLLTGWGVFALGRNNPKVRAILTQVAGYHTEVIKFLPPLTITREDIDYFLLAMESVLDDLRHVPGHAWNTVLGLAKGAMRA